MHYRGADWLQLRAQDPQKRWIPGEGRRVRISLLLASFLSTAVSRSVTKGLPYYPSGMYVRDPSTGDVSIIETAGEIACFGGAILSIRRIMRLEPLSAFR